jgi:hypothetical protein
MDTQFIYVKMLEGTTNYVPCKAIFKADNAYQIIANENIDLIEDATAIWQFFPGDVVRCIERTEMFFSFGGGVLIPVDPDECENCIEMTIMLAAELIESTFPNRKLYQLIYIIVEHLGEVEAEDLTEYKNEIDLLCSDLSITQRRHPIIRRWIEKTALRLHRN